MAARGLLGLLSLILVAGGLLLGIFILLAGAIDHRPISAWYFLQADTAAIPNAPPVSRWTLWNICDGSSGYNVCSGSGFGSISPARPFDPPSDKNFGTTEGVPAEFVNNSSFYFYMSRIMFSFALISLFFGACTLAFGVLAPCFRLGAKLSGFLCTLAFLFQAATAALMTATYIKARNAFRDNGNASDIGIYAFAFEWASFACFFLATVFFCMGGSGKKKDSYKSTGAPSAVEGTTFGRSQSTRSRGSFINGDMHHDKEYA